MATMKRRGIQPFDADHLTPPERDLQTYQEHQTCVDCDNLSRQHRGGARVCTVDLDVAAVLRGDVVCGEFLQIKRD